MCSKSKGKEGALIEGDGLQSVTLLKALILGIVEGVTEFLPVSSTGHLVVVGSLLGWNDEKGKLFEIVIQLAAILAVVWIYRGRLAKVIADLPRDSSARRFAANVVIAFLPAAALGALFAGAIKRVLFAPVPVALAFIVGGVLILMIERLVRRHRIDDVAHIKPSDALAVGLAQSLALVPGMSRSAATIMGGMLRGLSRKAATEFSFFLAIPVMFAATGYELIKERHLLSSGGDWAVLGVGCLASFVSAAFAIRALLRFISHHDFKVFAWYRIAFGLFILASDHFLWVQWQPT